MHNTIRLLLAGQTLCMAALYQKLKANAAFDVLALATNGRDAYRQFMQMHPDVTITELELPEMDGLSLAAHLGNTAKMIVYSYVVNDWTLTQLQRLRVQNVVCMPACYEEVLQHITTVAGQPADAGLCMAYTGELLRQVGMPAHLKGYQYAKEVVCMGIRENGTANRILTKKIYPEIAEKYHTAVNSVQHAITHAIERTWSVGNLDAIELLFGDELGSEIGRPTNSEFFGWLCEYVQLKLRSQP